MNPALRRVLLAAVVAASACSEIPPSGSGGETVKGFRTSQLHYDAKRVAAGTEIRIPYVYHNATDDTVYFVNCNELIVPSLEKRMGDTWTPVWSGTSAACLSPPLRTGLQKHQQPAGSGMPGTASIQRVLPSSGRRLSS